MFLDLFDELNNDRIKYMVAGGFAAALYGVCRHVADLDLIVDFGEVNIERLIHALRELGYRPNVPVQAEALMLEKNRLEWMTEKNMVAFCFINLRNTFRSIDILLQPTVSFETAYKRRQLFLRAGLCIPAISQQDLIYMKRHVGRTQDLYDIAGLLGKALKPTIVNG